MIRIISIAFAQIVCKRLSHLLTTNIQCLSWLFQRCTRWHPVEMGGFRPSRNDQIAANRTRCSTGDDERLNWGSGDNDRTSISGNGQPWTDRIAFRLLTIASCWNIAKHWNRTQPRLARRSYTRWDGQAHRVFGDVIAIVHADTWPGSRLVIGGRTGGHGLVDKRQVEGIEARCLKSTGWYLTRKHRFRSLPVSYWASGTWRHR